MVQAFAAWARNVPKSIPQHKQDAAAMASACVLMAGEIRRRISNDQAQNNMPGGLQDPLHYAAQQVAALGGAFTHYAALIDHHYGPTAAMLATPSTPTPEYLRHGR
jgi:hypothetical protein